MTAENELHKMIDGQVKLFRIAKNPFDCRKIFEDIEKKITDYTVIVSCRISSQTSGVIFSR